ncbi:MAG: sensor histidine kinase [Bryobacterales bacterium]|nr:sensor histidine kinase [Bryobacterales bacterium]
MNSGSYSHPARAVGADDALAGSLQPALSLPDISWGRYLSLFRPLLAAVFLVVQLLADPRSIQAIAVASAFLVYSALVAISQRAITGNRALAALLVDTLFFLLLCGFAPGPVWLSSLVFLFLIGATVSAFHTLEVLFVTAVCFLFLLAIRTPQLGGLEITVLVLGLFAVAASSRLQHHESAIAALNQKAADWRDAEARARDLERQKIADDFHDGPLQCLISFQMRLVVLRRLLERDREAGMSELQMLQDISVRQLRELRNFVRSMRPPELDGASLSIAARRLAETFQKEAGLAVTFEGDGPIETSPEVSGDILQLMGEALNNVHKHARATRVAVSMHKVGRNVEIAIDDNGTGFNFSGSYTLDELELLRLGPVSLKRRARSLSADVALESKPGRGSSLKIKVPIPSA